MHSRQNKARVLLGRTSQVRRPRLLVSCCSRLSNPQRVHSTSILNQGTFKSLEAHDPERCNCLTHASRHGLIISRAQCSCKRSQYVQEVNPARSPSPVIAGPRRPELPSACLGLPSLTGGTSSSDPRARSPTRPGTDRHCPSACACSTRSRSGRSSGSSRCHNARCRWSRRPCGCTAC